MRHILCRTHAVMSYHILYSKLCSTCKHSVYTQTDTPGAVDKSAQSHACTHLKLTHCIKIIIWNRLLRSKAVKIVGTFPLRAFLFLLCVFVFLLLWLMSVIVDVYSSSCSEPRVPEVRVQGAIGPPMFQVSVAAATMERRRFSRPRPLKPCGWSVP